MMRLSLLPTSHPLGFHPSGFGPPRGVTRASPCSWVVHAVSRLSPTTMRPIQTRFPYGFDPEGLNQAVDDNSPDHYAKGTPSHLRPVATPNDAPTACRHAVSGSPCTPLTGVLSIFQSPYLSTIGRQVVFSLTGWSPWIQSGFHVPRPTQVPLG